MSAVAAEVNASNNAMIGMNTDADLLALLGEVESVLPGSQAAPLTIVEEKRTTMLDDILATDTADADAALADLLGATDAAVPVEAVPAPVAAPEKPAAKGKGKTAAAKPAAEKAPKKAPATRKKKAEAPGADETPPAPVAKPEAAPAGELPKLEAVPEPAPEQKRTQQRMTFATKSEKIAHRLGDKDVSFLILDTKDQALSADEQADEQARVLAMVDEMPIKVGEKATMLFNFLQNRGQLNEVMRRAFTVLLEDGFLSGGSKGNLISNLLTKPYSPGTASSQTTQMFALFPALKICFPRENGQIAMNPDSTILAMFRENPELLVSSRKR